MSVTMLTAKDADSFCLLRLRMFEELGDILPSDPEEAVAAFMDANRDYYLSHTGKDLFCFGVFEDGVMAATAAICLFNRLPYDKNLSGREAYVLNVYTRPEFRGRGFAEALVAEIEKFSEEKGIEKLWLNASPMGKPLYLKRGFTENPTEMDLFL